nr:MAG TPA: zinc finger protein [Caudoviricetes sp.]
MPTTIISYRFNSDVSSRLAFCSYGFSQVCSFCDKS